ncbi:MAG TPA: FAD-dependent oxidoreductase [Planctomycetota bacterium]|jgi:hypothetical protein
MRFFAKLLSVLFVASAWAGEGIEALKVDVCVYGGTSAGVIAAVAVAKAGKSVILIEPGRHLGGLSSGGLGETDIGNKMVIGGLSRDFYKRIGKAYGKEEAWKFEPSVAEKVFDILVAENKIRVLKGYRLSAVEKNAAHITRVFLEPAPTDDINAPITNLPQKQPIPMQSVEAAVFIDATYEGDLMAKAKVSYAVGREAVSKYNEPLNGVRERTPSHQFGVKVDPYVKPGDAASGLIPFVQAGDGGKPGDGDASVQAYNFRLCLTQNADNKIPFSAPPGYDAARYELMGRYLEALVAEKKPLTPRTFLKIDMMPNGKTDINNNGAVSTDFIGQNYAYPDGDYSTRNKIWHAHHDYIKGLLFFMATSERVPAALRAEMNRWGFCKDEFKDTGGWPHQMYVREARRMIGRYVITQNDCEHKTTADDSVGMGAYNMDSHNCQRLVKNGAVRNEGDVQVGPKGPYPISYRSITPKAEECDNLIVPVCISASHIAYGSARMEPVFMVLGQSSAVAACQAIDEKKSVQEIDIKKLQKTLQDSGQVLYYTAPGKGK